MEIYNLCFTETYSTDECHSFVTMDDARKKMHEMIAEKCGIPYEEVSSDNGYEDGNVSVCYDYARVDGCMYWEIIKSSLTDREVAVGQIMQFIKKWYVVPSRLESVLYEMINKYDNDIILCKTAEEFFYDYIMGEQLYLVALEKLGGKNTQEADEAIHNYIDEGNFVSKNCKKFNDYFYCEENNMSNTQRWFLGMLAICDGNTTFIEQVRKDIDSELPADKKVFELSKEDMVEDMVKFIHQEYNIPTTHDYTIRKMLNEYSAERISKFSANDFIESCFIGEAVYENALEQLGGKTTEFAYETISNRFGDDDFVNVCHFDELEAIEGTTDRERWFYLMIAICSGDKAVIKSVRNDIDKYLDDEDKIFVEDELNEMFDECKEFIDKSHRQLCSELNDAEYLAMMRTIMSTNTTQLKDDGSMEVAARNFYIEAKRIMYNAIIKCGSDKVLPYYEGICEINFDIDEGMFVEFGGVFDVAYASDMVKKKLGVN